MLFFSVITALTRVYFFLIREKRKARKRNKGIKLRLIIKINKSLCTLCTTVQVLRTRVCSTRVCVCVPHTHRVYPVHVVQVCTRVVHVCY
jgi:hypothetical protein